MAFVRTGLAAAILLATLTSCGLPAPETASGTTALPTAAAPTENASLPPTESPPPSHGSGNNGSSGNNGNNTPESPWVSVPTMPAGGDVDDPEGLPAGVHCVQASNLADDVTIPPEVELTIAEIKIISGGGDFTVGGSGCKEPVCAPGFRWTGDTSTCYVPLTEQGDWRDSRSFTILLVGRAECAPGRRAPCEAYRDQVNGRPTQVSGGIFSTRPTTDPTADPTSTSEGTSPTATS